MAAKPGRVPRLRKRLRADGRRETSMAEAPAAPGGSPVPAAPPSPRGSAGPQEDERCPGGGSPEPRGAAADPEEKSDSEPFSKLKKPTPSSCGRKPRASSSCGKEQNSFRLSPIFSTPGAKRSSWRRSSLKGRRSRRKSLPPVHHKLLELSQTISLELPEVQRLSSLLLCSFQFVSQQLLQDSPGFNSEDFSARVQAGSEQFQRLLQRLLQDGTLGNCLEPTSGDPLEPALEGSVAQVKELMASFSQELHSWQLLLQQHQQRAQEASRNLELLRAGSFAPPPPQPQNPKILQILHSKPDYSQILAQQGSVLTSLRLLMDEVQQAGKLVMRFSEESRKFLRGLSERLASRAFRKLQGSPVRRLLEQKTQRELAVEGE